MSKQEIFGKIPFRICCFSRADGSSTKSQCKQVTQMITELIDKIRIGTQLCNELCVGVKN